MTDQATDQPPIHLVVALPAEAKPVTAHFGLQRQMPERGYPLYRRANLDLIISGPGRVAAAAATAWLQAESGHHRDGIWLNLGIAGHRHHSLGHALLAERIIDPASGAEWALAPPTPSPLPQDTLVSQDLAQHDYPDDRVYEMEAAGFYPTACRFSDPRRVQCLKVISDNEGNPVTGISGKRVRQWITAQLPALETVLRWLSTELPPEPPP